MKMIIVKDKLFLFLTVVSIMIFLVSVQNRLLADHFPESPSSPFIESEINIRAFYKMKPFNLYSEFKQQLEGNEYDFRYRSLTFGSYYRLIKYIKLGVFYRFQQGARHDDDWVATFPGWEWRNTNTRGEHVLIGDITPRYQLTFLPGTNWILELKNRYLYNFYNGHHTIKIRPGLTYVLMDGIEPFMNFFLRYEMYIPVNYSSAEIYEQWVYAGILYHYSKIVKIGFYGAYREITWSDSEDFKNIHPTVDYEETYRSLMLGISLIFMF